MEIRRVSGALGAEIPGVDLRDPDLDFEAVYEAFLEHEVIFFRRVHLSEEEHLALGRRFGIPSIYPVARVMGATEPSMTVIEDGPDSPLLLTAGTPMSPGPQRRPKPLCCIWS